MITAWTISRFESTDFHAIIYPMRTVKRFYSGFGEHNDVGVLLLSAVEHYRPLQAHYRALCSATEHCVVQP